MSIDFLYIVTEFRFPKTTETRFSCAVMASIRNLLEALSTPVHMPTLSLFSFFIFCIGCCRSNSESFSETRKDKFRTTFFRTFQSSLSKTFFIFLTCPSSGNSDLQRTIVRIFSPYHWNIDNFSFSTFYWLFRPESEIIVDLASIFNGSIPLPIVHTMDTAERHQIALYWVSFCFVPKKVWIFCFRQEVLSMALDGSIYWGRRLSVRQCCSPTQSLSLLVFSSISTSSETFYQFVILNELQGNVEKQPIDPASEATLSISHLSGLWHGNILSNCSFQSFVPVFTAYYPAGSALLLPVIGTQFFNFRHI